MINQLLINASKIKKEVQYYYIKGQIDILYAYEHINTQEYNRILNTLNERKIRF